jgi:hypothetical protein
MSHLASSNLVTRVSVVRVTREDIFISDEISGSHGYYHHVVVVEVFGFGAMWFCRSMLTFRRNMLSPSSGTEVTSREVESLYNPSSSGPI